MEASKVIMSICNSIFWLLGGAMLGVGIWMLVDETVSENFQVLGDDVLFEISLYVIISAGGLIFLVGILGCIGACTANSIILILYGVFVGIVIVAELAAIALMAVFYTNIYKISYDMYYDVRYRYVSENSSDTLSVAWNNMQIRWECCGSYSHYDYSGSYFQSNAPAGVYVPWTCCELMSSAKSNLGINDVQNYTECQREAFYGYNYRYLNSLGCYYKMEEIMELAVPIFLAILSAFVIIQSIGIGTSCCLRKKNQGVRPA